MSAIAGTEEGVWQEAGIFTPGTAMATSAGLEALRGPRSIERSRRRLKEAGYNQYRSVRRFSRSSGGTP